MIIIYPENDIALIRMTFLEFIFVKTVNYKNRNETVAECQQQKCCKRYCASLQHTISMFLNILNMFDHPTDCRCSICI